MKNQIILFLCIMASIHLCAQCYEPHLKKADAAYARGNYKTAAAHYDSALCCPDSRSHDNGSRAKEVLYKCLPVLTVNGEKDIIVKVSSDAGKQSFDIKSLRLSSWSVISNTNNGLSVTPDVADGKLTVSWNENTSTAPREWLITISGEGGFRPQCIDMRYDAVATIQIIQANGCLTVNGRTHLERSFSWEGGVTRFDVGGIPSGLDYTISGIDASWMSVQKESDHFFLIVNTNESKIISRDKSITVSCNNQSATIHVTQSDCRNKADIKSKARINLGELKGNPDSMIPFRKKGVAGLTDQTGKIIYLSSSQFFFSQMELNRYRFNIFNEFYLPNQDALFPITPNCFMKTVIEEGNCICTLYSQNGNKLQKIGIYRQTPNSEEDKIKVHIYQNLDFAISYAKPSTKHSNGFDYFFELYEKYGTLIHKNTSSSQPGFYEGGIVVWQQGKGKLITRNGAIYMLPSEADWVEDIGDGVVLYCKKGNAFMDSYFGYCHLNGKIIKKARYISAAPFSNGFALVSKDWRQYYFIDKNGENHVLKSNCIRSFSDSLCAVDNGYFIDLYDFDFQKKYSIRNVGGGIEYNKVISAVDFRFNEGISIIRVESSDEKYTNKLSYCDKKGKRITNMEFIQALPFKNGLARATVDRKSWCVLNRNGWIHEIKDVFIHPPSYNPDGTATFNGLLTLQTVDSIGNIFDGTDVNGITIGSTSISPTVFSVNDVFGFFNDTLGVVTIQPQFNQAQPFSEELAAVKIGEKWGYIDKSGKIVIPTIFDSAGQFTGGRAKIVIDGKNYFIDKRLHIIDEL